MIKRYLEKFPEIVANGNPSIAKQRASTMGSLEGEALAVEFRNIEITDGWETAIMTASELEQNGIDSEVLKKALLRSERL